MTLYHIEYEIIETKRPYVCKVLGNNEHDAVNSLSNKIGKIRIIDIHRANDVDLISDGIKDLFQLEVIKKIQDSTRIKGIKPRKFDLI